MTIDINLYMLKATDGKHYVLETYLDAIQGVMCFMKKVVYGKELFSTPYVTRHGKKMTTISSLGKHLQYVHKYSRLFSKDYQFSPLIEFFFEEYRKHPIKSCLQPMLDRDRVDVDLFNDFVTTMRKNVVASKVKKQVADWESKSKKNIKRLGDFQAELFKRRTRVMAVRLDFNYHKAVFTPAEIDRIISESATQKMCDEAGFLNGCDISQSRPIEGRIALEEVQQDRRRLFSNMKGKPSLFKHLVGYVWCIECGRAAGYHLHVVLFFDGAYVQKHEHIAQEVGCYWKNVITNGRGYFENCNLKKAKYGDSWAFGLIDNWDTVKCGNLSRALSYFCKQNQMVQVVPYPGCRLFGSGFIHRQPKTRGGRPRTKFADGYNQ